MNNIQLIDMLNEKKRLEYVEWTQLFSDFSDSDRNYAAKIAHGIAIKNFGHDIFVRGLIEISNICKNDCLYCGIRKSNRCLKRYRMSREEIMSCCNAGHAAGFKTFVLQGGEDAYFTDDMMCGIISAIRTQYPECAITLSLGEKSRASYKRMFDAGADRYLLRHETADEAHYKKLHPGNLSFKNRMTCLSVLKEIGYQTGCGMMIGSPFQTAENLAADMLFMAEFRPHMIGVGPFIPAKNTPFENCAQGSLELTLFVLSLCRIMLPDVLLPATTALGTIAPNGRELGILCGANVVMPNLSPTENRKKYMLYDNKIGTADDPGDSKAKIEASLAEMGYRLSGSRGDYRKRS